MLACSPCQRSRGKSFTLLISPSAIPTGQTSTVVVRAFTGQNTPLAGVTLAISGATVSSRSLVTSTTGLILHLTPSSTEPIQVKATAPGYRSVVASIGVAAQVPPAVVSILDTLMSMAGRQLPPFNWPPCMS